MLTYEDETWSIKRKHRHKLLATEMDYLRRSARISQMDRIRHETIGKKMGIKQDILQVTEEQQLRWYGHIMQLHDCRIVTQVAEWYQQGKRRCSRPVNI
jgi:hypothetical protein